MVVIGDLERAMLIDIKDHGFRVLNKSCDPVQISTFLAQCTIQ